MGSWSLSSPHASGGRSRGSPFGLKPVLVDVGVQVVCGRTSVVVPEVGLPEADLVQGPFRQTREAVGDLFRVGERADQRLDPPGLSLEVRWSAYVARLLRGKNPDKVAGLERHGPSQRRSISAALSSISSLERTSFSMSSFSVAATQRSQYESS